MNIQKLQEHTNRLDVEMHSRALARSRSAATDYIKRGHVRVNGAVVTKPSAQIRISDDISLDNKNNFVSRSGEKLAFALKEWNVDVNGIEALDIGSSTGGFTDCLLRNGAKKVIAVDVGRDQLAKELRDDSRVELHEDVDIRRFSLPSPVELVVADVSFISLRLVLPKIYEFLKRRAEAIVLVKPQFEVGMEIAKKYEGVITDEDVRSKALDSVIEASKKIGFKIIGHIPSPIEGEKGNKEFLLRLKRPLIS